MRWSLPACVVLISIAAGCAATPPPALPQPAIFHISATMNVDLPAPLAAQTGLPTTIKATLDATAHSEALSADPMRSRHQGHMRLVVTDGSGTHSLADVNIDVSGDSDGSPTEGLGLAIDRFLNAASMMSANVPPAATRNNPGAAVP